MANRYAWECAYLIDAPNHRHVIPLNDVKPHIDSGVCPCRPEVKLHTEDGECVYVYMHSSWDRRETLERLATD